MMTLIFSLVLFAMAAICNAVMDKLKFHYDTSVFRKLNKNFWHPDYSWRVVKFIPLTKYRPDAWHLFKSGMIVCLAAACVVLLAGTPAPSKWWHWPGMLYVYGMTWNWTFNFFFNKILAPRNVW